MAHYTLNWMPTISSLFIWWFPVMIPHIALVLRHNCFIYNWLIWFGSENKFWSYFWKDASPSPSRGWARISEALLHPSARRSDSAVRDGDGFRVKSKPSPSLAKQCFSSPWKGRLQSKSASCFTWMWFTFDVKKSNSIYFSIMKANTWNSSDIAGRAAKRPKIH